MTIRAPNPGEPITAAWAAMVVDELDRLSREASLRSAGNPVLEAMVLSLTSLEPSVFVAARIMDVRLSGAGVSGPSGTAYLGSQVSYRIRGIRRGGIDLDNQFPVYGRPVRGDEARIYPALQGMVCFIVRSPAATGAGGTDAQLMLLPGSEVVARRSCTAPPPGLAGGGARLRREEPVQLAAIVGSTETAGPETPSDGGTVTPGGRL